MSAIYDCADETQRSEGLTEAAAAVLKGELVVLPTDTTYGLGADAHAYCAAGGRGEVSGDCFLFGDFSDYRTHPAHRAAR